MGHRLYDGSFVLEDPADDIGDLLRSAAGAEAIAAVGQALDRLLDAAGPGLGVVDHLRHPLWEEVTCSAARALALLEAP